MLDKHTIRAVYYNVNRTETITSRTDSGRKAGEMKVKRIVTPLLYRDLAPSVQVGYRREWKNAGREDLLRALETGKNVQVGELFDYGRDAKIDE